MNYSKDLRDDIFAAVMCQNYTARVTVEGSGIICGLRHATEKLQSLGAIIHQVVDDGTPVVKGDVILTFTGNPKCVAMAEDMILGYIAKPSGIASAARRAVELTGGKVDIVSGAWKKMPWDIKHLVRHAVMTGGSIGRIVPGDFIYLDKNYVRIFGSVKNTLNAVKGFSGYTKVIQLRGELQDIGEEARDALEYGADILMVDTGSLEDLQKVGRIVQESGCRDKIKIAFAGSILIDQIPTIIRYDVDILDIGSQIIDAPLLDLKLDVITT